MFKGSALTFGGVAYHGEAPFTRYTLNTANTGADFLYAPRGTTAGDPFSPSTRIAPPITRHFSSRT